VKDPRQEQKSEKNKATQTVEDFKSCTHSNVQAKTNIKRLTISKEELKPVHNMAFPSKKVWQSTRISNSDMKK
jgi:hypothetical protein